MSFWEQYNEWQQNDLEPYKVKYTPYLLLVSRSLKFQSFHSMAFLRVTGHFETSASNHIKLLGTLKGEMHPYVLLVSPSVIFFLFHSTYIRPAFFLSYRTFWDKCTKWLQMTLNPTRSNILYMTPNDLEPYKAKHTPYVLLVSRVSNFSHLTLSTASRFRATCNFEKSALNDPKMTLNPTVACASCVVCLWVCVRLVLSVAHRLV